MTPFAPSAFLLVALGGALGAVLRHWVAALVADRLRHAAFGTFAVNLSGAFLIGIAAASVFDPEIGMPASSTLWLLLVTGVLGSYTTVSSFSLQTLQLLREHRVGAALANIAGSLTLCICAAAIGFALIYGFSVSNP